MNLAMMRKPLRVQRPPAVTWLAGLVFLLGMANLSIVVTGLARRSVLGVLPLSISLPVLMALGGLWAAVWIGTAWGLFRLQWWSRRMAPILFAIYEIVTLGKQVLFAQESYADGRMVFAGIMGSVLLTLMILILNRPAIREAFHQDESPSLQP